MAHFKYQLQAYKGPHTRFTCPACGKAKRFKRYIDTATGEYISDTTGKCDREIKCGYHQTPKQYFESKGGVNNLTSVCLFALPSKTNKQTSPASPCSYIAPETVKASSTGFENNRFISYLTTLFPVAVVNGLIVDYRIGSSNKWPGATVFWQLDSTGRARTGKIMLYNANTGRRVKQPYNHVGWMHRHLKLSHYNLQQCLFGQHLLHLHPNAPVALVESEKTALIANVYMPEFIWLATGSLQGLSARMCQPLKGRQVVLWPDIKGYATWAAKAAELKHLAKFTVSHLLETVATPEQRQQGCDLADYLVNFDYRTFKLPLPQPAPTPPPVQAPAQKRWVNPAKKKADDELLEKFSHRPRPWDMQTPEAFYATYSPPTGPIQLSACETITNPAQFISSHLATVRGNKNNPAFKPFYDRLVQVMERSATANKTIGGDF